MKDDAAHELRKTDADRAAAVNIDEVLAEVAQDRAELLAAIRTEAHKHAFPAKPWRVIRQFNHKPDVEICAHRWEWLADVCAYRRTARHASEIGVFYTVRRAER